jgi:hypothetical protein
VFAQRYLLAKNQQPLDPQDALHQSLADLCLPQHGVE